MAKKVVKKPVKKAAAKKTAIKKTASKKVSKKSVKKIAVPKKSTSKTSIAKKESKPIRKAVKAVSARRVKVHKPEVKVEDIVESRNKAIQKIKGYGKRDLDHFRQIILEKRDEIIEQLQNLKEQMLGSNHRRIHK